MILKRIIFRILIVCLAYTLLSNPMVLADAVKKDYSDPDTVQLKRITEQLLTNYYEGLVSGLYIPSDRILEDTDNTYLWKGYAQAETKAKFMLYQGVANYKFTIDYQAIEISGEYAELHTKINYDFYYRSSPEHEWNDRGTAYDFVCHKTDGKWYIANIDCKEMFFKKIKRTVDQYLLKNKSKSFRQAVDWYIFAREEDAKFILQERNEMREKSLLLEKQESTLESTSIQESEDISIQENTYTYQGQAKACDYAFRFGESPNNSPFCYYQGEDCTNFVSQCIWAGYGAYPYPYDDAKLKENMLNKVRMVPGVWAADEKGALMKWCRVDTFYDYVTDKTKTYGPKGDGINDEGKYVALSAYYLHPGNVLQFRFSNSTGNYNHSVLVTFRRDPVS
jgi:hypothetical protein